MSVRGDSSAVTAVRGPARCPRISWAACQSQEPWAISWRHIPARQFPAARTAAFGELERTGGPGGTLTLTGATAREPVSSGELKDPGT